MAFDEKGQADSFERVAICERAYRLLTERSASRRRHHLRPNIFAIATGIDEHNDYAVNFIEASTRTARGATRIRMFPAACPTCRSRSAATTRCAKPSTACSCTTPSRPA
jgi:cobalamin-dependent methionine synthase I